jgi:uncharacterized protein YjiS (DUF1127 family)
VSDCADRFAHLVRHVEDWMRARRGVELRRLPEQQLYVRRTSIDDGKQLEPAGIAVSADGYQLFVACRAGGDEERGLPTAAIRPPVADARASVSLGLRVGEATGYWRVRRSTGDVVEIRVEVGPEAPREEVSELLRLVDEALLSDGSIDEPMRSWRT